MKNEKNKLKLQTQNNKTINSVMPDLDLLVACGSAWCGLDKYRAAYKRAPRTWALEVPGSA